MGRREKLKQPSCTSIMFIGFDEIAQADELSFCVRLRNNFAKTYWNLGQFSIHQNDPCTLRCIPAKRDHVNSPLVGSSPEWHELFLCSYDCFYPTYNIPPQWDEIRQIWRLRNIVCYN